MNLPGFSSYGKLIPLLFILLQGDAYGTAGNILKGTDSTSIPVPGVPPLDDFITKLRLADEEPSKAILAVHAHNKNLNMQKKACYARTFKGKVINFGLPRTGTLSFIRVMNQKFDVPASAACHQLPNWPKYVREIYFWRAHPERVRPKLKLALRKCLALADIPNFALYRSYEVRYPSAHFVMTIRGKYSWLNSTELLMKAWKGRLPKEQLKFIQDFFNVTDPSGWDYEAYANTWEHHTREVLQFFGERILLLPTYFNDNDKLSALGDFLGCEPKQGAYAHSHVGNKWKLG